LWNSRFSFWVVIEDRVKNYKRKGLLRFVSAETVNTYFPNALKHIP